jgi:hypothetical protein
MRRWAILVPAILLGCQPGSQGGGGSDADAPDSGAQDAGPSDGGNATDAGPGDAGPADGGGTMDAGPVDAGTPDSGQPSDAGSTAFLFGLHTNHMTSWPVQAPFDTWRSLNSTGNEGGSTWGRIQLSDGGYDFGLIDEAMMDAADAGVAAMFTPYGTPEFAASDVCYNYDGSPRPCCKGSKGLCFDGGVGCHPPADLNPDGSGTNQTWKSFIAALAQHVHERHSQAPEAYADITYWENGNEYITNGQQFCGSYAQMARMLQDEKCIVTGRGPACDGGVGNRDAKMMTVAMYPPEDGDGVYLQTVPDAGPDSKSPADLADIVNIHCYSYQPPGNSFAPPERIIHLIEEGLPELRTYVPGKPIFCTEGGWGVAPASWADTATYMPRLLLSVASTGVMGFNLFGYDFYHTESDADAGPGLGDLWVSPADEQYNPACSVQTPLKVGTFCPAAPGWIGAYRWVQGVTFAGVCKSQPVSAGGNIWTCGHTSSLGTYSDGEFVWYDLLDQTTAYSVPSPFVREEDLEGRSTTVTPGSSITLSNSPVLLADH